MNILSQILNNARKGELAFGLNDNCVLVSVSKDTRKKEDGTVIKRHGFTKFGKLNENNNIVAEKEISFMDLDHSDEKLTTKFLMNLGQMTYIIDTFMPVQEDKDTWEIAFDKILEVADIKFEENDDITVKTAKFTGAIKNKATLETITVNLLSVYHEILDTVVKTPVEERPKVRIKIIYDNKGTNLVIPSFSKFIEPMTSSDLKMTATDEASKNKTTTVSSVSISNI